MDSNKQPNVLYGVVNVELLNVRSTPIVRPNNITRTLKRDTNVSLITINNDKFYKLISDGKHEYVMRDFIDIVDEGE